MTVRYATGILVGLYEPASNADDTVVLAERRGPLLSAGEVMDAIHLMRGNKPLDDSSALVRAYHASDLASPYRSTVPLLGCWTDAQAAIRQMSKVLGMNFDGPVRLSFEHQVSVQKGDGKASCTDLMLLTRTHAVAIEAKSKEPEYESVATWLRTPPSPNRIDVLEGWLDLIRRASGVDPDRLTQQSVADVTYQLIHRTASACHPQATTRAVVYVCFDPAAGSVSKYEGQMRRLREILGETSPLRFYVLEVRLQKSGLYQELQRRWDAGERKMASEVEHGLLGQSFVACLTQSVTVI
jgi:hypothetical protein